MTLSLRLKSDPSRHSDSNQILLCMASALAPFMWRLHYLYTGDEQLQIANFLQFPQKARSEVFDKAHLWIELC